MIMKWMTMMMMMIAMVEGKQFDLTRLRGRRIFVAGPFTSPFVGRRTGQAASPHFRAAFSTTLLCHVCRCMFRWHLCSHLCSAKRRYSIIIRLRLCRRPPLQKEGGWRCPGTMLARRTRPARYCPDTRVFQQEGPKRWDIAPSRCHVHETSGPVSSHCELGLFYISSPPPPPPAPAPAMFRLFGWRARVGLMRGGTAPPVSSWPDSARNGEPLPLVEPTPMKI